MNIHRIISIYEKHGERLIKEIDANKLDLEFIKMIFIHFDGDANFYRPYKLDKLQYDYILSRLKELGEFSFQKYEIYLEALSK